MSGDLYLLLDAHLARGKCILILLGMLVDPEIVVLMNNGRNLAVGATIMVVGIGGHIGYGGFLPIKAGIFPSGLPAIATAAVLGILINAIFLIFKPLVAETEVLDEAMAAAD